MKFPFFSVMFLSSILACPCCNDRPGTNAAFADSLTPQADSVERYYFVEGMTCAGCVFGVKKALERAGLSKEAIIDVDYRKPDPENRIGHARVHISKKEFGRNETDCRIVKEIKSNPGYVAYWDQSNKDPCGLNQVSK